MDPVRRARLRAFAKVNLNLAVLGTRPDGYHELRTVFQTISLADRLTIEYSPAARTAISIDCVPHIPGNLVERAARGALAAMRIRASVRFRLEKHIPMGGGLGGGSSDAAAVLLALPVLAGRSIEPEKLERLALELGSDVPFFLHGGTAAAAGRGEELYPLDSPGAAPLLLVVPPVHVSTAEAYRRLARPPLDALTESQRFNRMKKFRSFTRAVSFCARRIEWQACCDNDFEAVVFRQYPLLKSLRHDLCQLGAVCAGMSGSGSALFGVFESRPERDKAARAVAGKHPDVRVEEAGFVSRTSYRGAWQRMLAGHLKGNHWPPRSRYVA